MGREKIILINQTANYLFADIIKAFVQRLPHSNIEAWYGTFDYDMKELPANVTLQQGPAYNRESFTKRFGSWWAFYKWMKDRIKQEDLANTKFFFVSNPPLFVFTPGIEKMQYACLIYDLYPDVLSGFKGGFVKDVFVKRWQRRNRKILPHAQCIFTIGEGLKQAIQQYLPAAEKDKVKLIPVWNKAIEATQTSLRDFKKEWGLEGKHIILYSGNLGLTHPLEYLIELAKKLSANPEWQIVIVGNGGKKAQLQALAAGMDNVTLKDPVPFADLPNLLSTATWGYVTLDTAATNSSVPSKTFNLLASGIPVLAMVNESSEIARLLDKYNAGIYFKENEIDHTVDKILRTSAAQHGVYASNAISCSKDFTSQLAAGFVDHWIKQDVPQLH